MSLLPLKVAGELNVITHISFHFLSQNPCTLLKIIEDPKELLFPGVVLITIYHIRNLN